MNTSANSSKSAVVEDTASYAVIEGRNRKLYSLFSDGSHAEWVPATAA
ncbi:hypothetical protein [Arthrobacter pityocampae]|nr:hypothetical protein [Arthrobacter pityocampae]